MINLICEAGGFADKYIFASMIVFAFLLSAFLLKALKNHLPRDSGRDFAFDGKLSAGKPRGAGAVVIIAFILSGLIFAKLKAEYLIYYVLIFAGMMSGYLDDRSSSPWGEYKKGAIDLLVAAAASAAFVRFNPDKTTVDLFVYQLRVPPVAFACAMAVFLWLMINAANCTDGIDGFFGSLAVNSLVFIMLIGARAGLESDYSKIIVVMLFSILAYLWFNAEPSSLLMGDAGSRAIGLFIGLSAAKTGNIILCIPLCFIILFDGLIGIVKVSMIRFLKIKALTNIRTPIHDHVRKNKGWSNTQVIFRFQLLQSLISAVTLILTK
jgi:phospho-N-acetylmuramoyl-pentapeptide-transferase